MGLRHEEEQAMPNAQRVAVLKAEMEARLAALEGGEPATRHVGQIKWCAAAIYALTHTDGVMPGGPL